MGKLIINTPRSVEFYADHIAVECDTSQVSDSYHSFDELYDHRFELFVALMLGNPETSFRAKLNSDGGQYPGWIVAGMSLPNGQISYHLPERYWDRLSTLVTYDIYPDYDGHTSQDVIERLRVWSGIKASTGGLNS